MLCYPAVAWGKRAEQPARPWVARLAMQAPEVRSLIAPEYGQLTAGKWLQDPTVTRGSCHVEKQILLKATVAQTR
jgi:hypothetical protein